MVTTVIQMDLWKDHIGDQWLTFKKARAIVHSWGLEYEGDWINLVSGTSELNHPGIPQNPDFIYRHTGWNGWKDWLVHPDRRIDYDPFNEVQEFIWSLRLADEHAWTRYIQNDFPTHKSYGLNIPARPCIEYQGKGWVDWTDWLGTKMGFRSFEESKKFIRTLRLKSREEWNLYCKGNLMRPIRKPKVIYRYPEIAYKEAGWVSWEDWLGMV